MLCHILVLLYFRLFNLKKKFIIYCLNVQKLVKLHVNVYLIMHL